VSTEVAQRERRRLNLRAPITGFVLVLIVVFGGYYGWQAAFGSDELEAASNGCATTSVVATTGGTSTPASTAPPTTTPPITTTTVPTTLPSGSVPATSGLVLLPEDVTVNVYNATVRRGLANNTAAELRIRGFTISDVQNDPLEAVIPGVAEIRAATADMPEVRLLIQHVPGAVIVADGRAGTTVDLVLGETFSALGDPAAVTPVPIASERC
jgi:hypothetical protein